MIAMIAQRKCKKFWWLQWLPNASVRCEQQTAMKKPVKNISGRWGKKFFETTFGRKKKNILFRQSVFFSSWGKNAKEKMIGLWSILEQLGFRKGLENRRRKNKRRNMDNPPHARILVGSVTPPQNINYDEKLLLRCKISTTTSTKAWKQLGKFRDTSSWKFFHFDWNPTKQ